uniref:Uncharacterized protein n=1 Tax=Panagrolaimus sp. PS1159 TaxID=55785 RepID=A0AC35GL06_9BILA
MVNAPNLTPLWSWFVQRDLNLLTGTIGGNEHNRRISQNFHLEQLIKRYSNTCLPEDAETAEDVLALLRDLRDIVSEWDLGERQLKTQFLRILDNL